MTENNNIFINEYSRGHIGGYVNWINFGYQDYEAPEDITININSIDENDRSFIVNPITNLEWFKGKLGFKHPNRDFDDYTESDVHDSLKYMSATLEPQTTKVLYFMDFSFMINPINSLEIYKSDDFFLESHNNWDNITLENLNSNRVYLVEALDAEIIQN